MTLNNRGEVDGDSSDMEEPMASQSADVEAPLTHNSSKNNFFPAEEANSGPPVSTTASAATQARGSFKVIKRNKWTEEVSLLIYYFTLGPW